MKVKYKFRFGYIDIGEDQMGAAEKYNNIASLLP
jgi:hypothetical protein